MPKRTVTVRDKMQRGYYELCAPTGRNFGPDSNPN